MYFFLFRYLQELLLEIILNKFVLFKLFTTKLIFFGVKAYILPTTCCFTIKPKLSNRNYFTVELKDLLNRIIMIVVIIIIEVVYKPFQMRKTLVNSSIRFKKKFLWQLVLKSITIIKQKCKHFGSYSVFLCVIFHKIVNSTQTADKICTRIYNKIKSCHSYQPILCDLIFVF